MVYLTDIIQDNHRREKVDRSGGTRHLSGRSEYHSIQKKRSSFLGHLRASVFCGICSKRGVAPGEIARSGASERWNSVVEKPLHARETIAVIRPLYGNAPGRTHVLANLARQERRRAPVPPLVRIRGLRGRPGGRGLWPGCFPNVQPLHI